METAKEQIYYLLAQLVGIADAVVHSTTKVQWFRIYGLFQLKLVCLFLLKLKPTYILA
jgi:hypothetical protein